MDRPDAQDARWIPILLQCPYESAQLRNTVDEYRPIQLRGKDAVPKAAHQDQSFLEPQVDHPRITTYDDGGRPLNIVLQGQLEDAKKDFWNARNSWFPTWTSPAMEVSKVVMWQQCDGDEQL